MKQNQSKKKNKIGESIIILFSVIGIIIFSAILFPQVRYMIMDLAIHTVNKVPASYQSWVKVLLSFAIGGICFILFFDYCTLTNSGKALVQKIKQEIQDCISEIDFKIFVKPLLLMFIVYLLGILTIIRANYLYLDDIGRAARGYRQWYDWSRYVSEFSSIFIHGDSNLTDISPLPQLLAILILSISSILLVYIISYKRITIIRLLASIPLGLSPYFLECLAYKFDAPYMALSILANIVPFLFIARKKAFLFISIVSLLIMCMTYQATSGVYLLIAIILCFQDWNKRKKPVREIFYFFGTAVFAFCLAILIFKFFLMKPADYYYSSTAVYQLSNIIPGILSNIKNYIMTINRDWGMIWKVGVALVIFTFIIQSLYQSAQKKLFSFLVLILVIGISFILSYGLYIMLARPVYMPRALMGFGVFFAIICISVVSYCKKTAIILVLALNWCFFVFAFSYGNALADQARYTEFRINILLSDLNSLFPERSKDDMPPQFKNSIEYTPIVKNIAKHYPVIEKLVPKDYYWDFYYFTEYYNYGKYGFIDSSEYQIDFNTLNLPVVLDSYYHTIKSDGNHILVIFKH